MNKYKWLAALALTVLTACKTPLYDDVQSSSEIKSAISPTDAPPSNIHKMYLYINVGNTGMISFGTIYLTAKDFNDAFVDAATSCQVQVVSIFDERLQVLKESNFVLPTDARNQLFKADHSKLTDFAPDVIFMITNTSMTTTKQFARNTLTNYAYVAELQAYPSYRAAWKATIDLHPGQRTENGTPSQILARDIIKKMAADGILKNCSQQSPAGQ